MKPMYLAFAIVCITVSSAAAQKLGTVGRRMEASTRQAIGTLTKGIGRRAQVSPTISRRVAEQAARGLTELGQGNTPHTNVTAAPTASAVSIPDGSSLGLAKKTASVAFSTQPDFPTDAAMEQYTRALAEKNRALTKELEDLTFHTDIGKSVLFAVIGDPVHEQGTSLTVFKTNYQGQEEIYGIIATHTLPENAYAYNGSLHRQFQVQLQRADGQKWLVPAEVVQIAPRSMLDISLVKFNPDVQEFMRPLELAARPPAAGTVLFSDGYAAGDLTHTQRTVQDHSFISIRTDNNVEGDRRGLCGSPWLDNTGKVVAIHTGTVEGDGPFPDVSYGTHISFIHTLVEAYHHGGNALYDVTVNGHTLARLNIDEYVHNVRLFDPQGNRLAQTVMGKFSQSKIEEILRRYPQAMYVQTTSRAAQWSKDGILVENHSTTPDATEKHHWYNLQTRQIEPERPDGIKM